ncbi:MAG TPA: hypothetical protein VE967_05450 [Gemmatimonadaceae bacterium]|nr:hypothetical protein [Gemmatimonadaceae bacterium]
MSTSLRVSRLVVALIFVAVVAACIDWSRTTASAPIDIRAYISTVETMSGVRADFVTGERPAGADDGGPALTANVPAIVLKGGAARVTFTAPTEFSHVIVAVDGVPGYFDLALGGPTMSADVLIVYAQDVAAPAFWMEFASGNGGGAGVFASANTAFLGNATGPVQVNVTWNSKADVDLYVVDPRNNEIYYNARGPLEFGPQGPGPNVGSGTTPTSPAGSPPPGTSGGVLDIDSNAACSTDGPRAENIVWPKRIVPPHGEYTVRVNYWSECGETSTDYVVTVRIKGGDPVIIPGHFDGKGVGGSSGAGHIVYRFVF